MVEDSTSLRRFVQEHSQRDFAALVQRHLGLVYGTALRRVGGDTHLAEEVAQSVFVDLARKARALVHHHALEGWLYTSTVYASAKAVRSAQRRRRREEQAHAMQELHQQSPTTADWAAVRPVLDDALHELNTRDREAIVLRFFGGRAFAEIGAVLAVSENGARMRVERALEKLRGQLARRGISSTLAALGTALTAQGAIAPPVGLAAAATTAAVNASAGVGGVTLFLQLIGMTKTQAALIAVVVAAGTATVGTQLQQHAELRRELAGTSVSRDVAFTQVTRDGDSPYSSVNQPQAAAHAARESELAQLREKATALRAQVAEISAAQATGRSSRGSGDTASSAPSFSANELDSLPRPASAGAPKYPFELKSSGIPGKVNLRLILDESGAVTAIEPLDSTHPAFTVAALDAVKNWRFEPGRKDGQAVRTQIVVPIQFSLSAGHSWF